MSGLTHDPRIATATAAVTAGSGIDAGWLQILPPYVSLTAACLGCILTVILIHNHLIAQRKLRLELQILRDSIPRRESSQAQSEQG